MKTSALSRVVLLLLRSRPFRGLLVVSGIAAMIVLATSTSMAALRLSDEQAAVSRFGTTQAHIQPLNAPTAGPGEPTPDSPGIATIDHRLSVIRYRRASPTLANRQGEYVDTHYTELSLPSPVYEGSYELTAGRWPQEPGDCAATAQFADTTRPPLGSWELRIVGRIIDIFEPGSTVIACGPGTWERWDLPAAQSSLTSFVIQADYYLMGDPDQVAAAAAALIDQGYFAPYEIELRAAPTTSTGPSARRFLFDQAPMAAIPLVLAVVLGGLVARWGGALSRVLERAGVARRPMRWAVFASAVLGAAACALAGGLLGSLLALALRPALVAWVAEQPLSPWRLLAGEVGAITLTTALGAALGCWFGEAARNRVLRQVDAPARPLTARSTARLIAAAAALGAGSVCLALMSAGHLWPMVLGAITMVAAVGCLAPVILYQVSTRLARRPVSAPTLAGRILVDDAGRWGTVSAAITMLLGLVIAVFLVASATVAGMQKMSTSQIPPGTVMLEVANLEGQTIPDQVRTQFERDLGVTDPIRLIERDAYVPGQRTVQFFNSTADAEQALGGLTADARSMLERGGILVLGGFQGTTATVEIAETDHLDVPVTAIKPEPAHRLNTGFGFAVLPNMPAAVQAAPPVREYLVYQGLTPAQDATARTWTDDTGFNVFAVHAYQPAQDIGLSATIAVGLAGFGLLTAPLLAGVLRREVHELRPLAATLRSIGLSRAWFRPAFTTTVLATVMPATILAVVGPTIVVAILAGLYPTVFELTGVPWWALAAFLVGVVAACYVATNHALRSLRRRETPVAI